MRGVTLRHRIDGGLIVFQPALPMRGVTGELGIERDIAGISTRTPHAGSDSACSSDRRPLGYFNPHSPCGE